jgi:hypothetical protein
MTTDLTSPRVERLPMHRADDDAGDRDVVRECIWGSPMAQGNRIWCVRIRMSIRCQPGEDAMGEGADRSVRCELRLASAVAFE